MCAENVPGLNHTPKSWQQFELLGRGATNTGRSEIVRFRGLYWRENAGMSSESKVRIFAAENLRVPGEGSSAQGKSGPKARPKGVVDGQQVEIPAPIIHVKGLADAGEDPNRGRGKTRAARHSENKSNEVGAITLTRKG